MKNRSNIVSLKLDPDLYVQIKRESARRTIELGDTVSACELMRILLKEGVDRHERKK